MRRLIAIALVLLGVFAYDELDYKPISEVKIRG